MVYRLFFVTEYWHIGGITIRFFNSNPLIWYGLNKLYKRKTSIQNILFHTIYYTMKKDKIHFKCIVGGWEPIQKAAKKFAQKWTHTHSFHSISHKNLWIRTLLLGFRTHFLSLAHFLIKIAHFTSFQTVFFFLKMAELVKINHVYEQFARFFY